MDYQDQLEKEKIDAKNSVEEYVYNMRDKIEYSLREYITDEDRSKFLEQLSATEEWLYDEGEDQAKKVYVNRLKVSTSIPSPLVGYCCTCILMSCLSLPTVQLGLIDCLVPPPLVHSLLLLPSSPPSSLFLLPSPPSQELQKLGDAVEQREREWTERPVAFNELGAAIIHFEKILEQYAAGVRSPLTSVVTSFPKH